MIGARRALTGTQRAFPPAGFAWEYLRRHEDYHHDFQIISRVKKPAANQLETFSQRWGLRFPVRSRNPR
ncbi:DUF6499 domain-containing protein [Bradyrhizobium sp. NAS80.1]|uniref:transcriptional regulator domain-containing protein n=1 Tax=Bradyrhizobium sp. NAS80.1 TaxID=1680159 RepID=UPI001FDA47F1|nr:DUF6499 domain-containing protein [Bradyrhizobium sp. NAS80.1]